MTLAKENFFLERSFVTFVHGFLFIICACWS